MTREALTIEELHEIIRLIEVENYSYRQAGDRMGRGKSTINDFMKRKTYKEFWEEYDHKPHAKAITVAPEDRRKRLSGKRFVFTCAQNNTYVNQKALDSLQVFADHKDAQLIVGTTYYNQNGYQTASAVRGNDDGCWFDPKIKGFMREDPLIVAKNLVFCGELNILPTAVNPLQGYHNYTKRESGIIAHNKVVLESLPTHIDEPEKFLYTTGSITYPNFIPKNQGQKAEHHHSFGALFVEVDEDGIWFARHLLIESDTGCFYDLTEYFTPDGVYDHTGASVEAINWGDLHVEKLDPEVAECSFGVEVIEENGTFKYKRSNKKNLLDTLKPRYQLLHDTADFTVRNHHNISDPHFRFASYSNDYDSVEDSMRQVADCVLAMTRDYSDTVIVESNHDQALARWLKTADYKEDPTNALFFLDRQLSYYKSLANKGLNSDGTKYHLFEDTLVNLNNELADTRVRFLEDGSYFTLFSDSKAPILCGYHGHKGANGARGSTKSFAKIGIRVNVGHSHSAMLFENVACAGVCGLKRMGYNDNSASSWSHSHIITYTNGKRIIVTIKNGKFCA